MPALAVAFATGYASWGHIEHVGITVGEPKAYLLPLAVDGMMLAGAFFALVDRIRGFEPRGWSIVALWLGSMLTIAFNMLSALGRGWAAMAVSAVFAVTFLVTVEAAFHPSRVVAGETARVVRRTARRMTRLAAAQARMAQAMTAPAASVVPESVASVPVSIAPAVATLNPAPAAETVTAPAEPVAEAAPAEPTPEPAAELPSWATLPVEPVDHTSPTAGYIPKRRRRPNKHTQAPVPEVGGMIEVTPDSDESRDVGLPPVSVAFSGNGGSMDAS